MTYDNTDAPGETTWWSTPPPGWSEVSLEVLTDWQHQRGPAPRLDPCLDLLALEFGYGSRVAYGAHGAWPDVVAQVRADWHASGRQGDDDWNTVAEAVCAGWTAAGWDAETAPLSA